MDLGDSLVREGDAERGQTDERAIDADAGSRLVSALVSAATYVEMTDTRRATYEPTLPWSRDAGSDATAYQYWLRDRADKGGQTRTVDSIADGPLISVVVPVYRPQMWFLRACVESVTSQTYANWELCLCDDGSNDPLLSDFLSQLTRAHRQIEVSFQTRNGGISVASNAAVAQAKGDFIAFLDHDDVLHAEALAEVAACAQANPDADVIYTDDDKVDERGRRYQPHFKPDWAPDLLLTFPYLGHLLVIRRRLLKDIGGLRSEYDGSQDYDLMLRATERARRVIHIPRVLYHWRAVAGSAASTFDAKPWAHAASRRALEEAMARQGIEGSVEPGPFPGAYHARRAVPTGPSLSIIIPFRDHAAMTVKCLTSLRVDPGFENFEVLLIDNGSIEPETVALRDRLARVDRSRVIDFPDPFNWSRINNLAASSCESDLLLFMNNDVEATRPGWLAAMVEHAVRPEVGAVGARLLFPNGVTQHAGVVLGINGIAGHLFSGLPAGQLGYFAWDRMIRPYSAVTGACLMVRRAVFEELGGFDEDLAVAFNDVDFGMRVSDAGYRIIYTPLAELVHYESMSRGFSGFFRDYRYFLTKWDRTRLRTDPFYNPNLSLFAPWCPLRSAEEEAKWEALIDELEGLPRRRRSP